MTVPNLDALDTISEAWVDEVTNLLNALAEPWTAHTPTVSQGASSNISKTVTYSKYIKVGRFVLWTFNISMTAAGTAGSPLRLSLPHAAASTGALSAGGGYIYDASANTTYAGAWGGGTASLIQLIGDWSNGAWGQGPSVAVASGDALLGFVIYEAAA